VVTTRGMLEDDMKEIAKLIKITITDYENTKEDVRKRVSQLCEKHPLY
ncbi:MAG: serine hydroxymethyltransferase, partial [Clostridia bacterium]|nr:serine hydroxymethyltransferase [Clostridia bacterium]